MLSLKKSKHWFIVMFFFFFPASIFAADATKDGMRASVIQFAKDEYSKILNNPALNPQQQLYQSSMPLLALATLKESADYLKILADMEHILNDESKVSRIDKSWQMWMLGRMVLASKLAANPEKLTQLKKQLATELLKNDNKEVISAWAIAYLASIDEASYQQLREKLLEYTRLEHERYSANPSKEASNFVWTLTMNLYAAANSGKKDYADFLNQLIGLTKSLKETSLLVPESDYRQWLVSVQRFAFALMGDLKSLKALPAINSSTVNNFDSMLAWANTLVMP